MARNRNHEADDERPERGVLDERRRFLAAAFLFVAVIGVVLLGAWLRTELTFDESTGSLSFEHRPGGSGDRSATTESRAPAASVRKEPVQRRVAAPVPEKREATGKGLAARADADRGRLVRSGGSHTVQLMVACDPGNALRVIESAGDSVGLYVLPVSHQGKACYRLCWGSYASQTAAEAARDLPSRLRSEFPDAPARTILDVTR